MLKTERLTHGGIIANYRCTAACRHCVVASSPRRAAGYIGADGARTLCALLREGGCRSVHVGGGEPFLDVDGLVLLARAAADAGITVEYAETNAYWAVDDKKAMQILSKIADAGIDTLCISIDPFHAEYVPYERPLRLAKLCERMGMGYFLWRSEFVSALRRLEPSKAHSRVEMARVLSGEYVKRTAETYGISYKGRAVNIEMEYGRRYPHDELADGRPCGRLMSGSHFHADLYNRFIPPGCTGLSLPLGEAIAGIRGGDGRYPAFEALYAGGTALLLRYAADRGFMPDPDGYPSNCAMCFFIRSWLAANAPTPDLDAEHYPAAMDYY